MICYLLNSINSITIKKIFFKATVVFIIKNNLTKVPNYKINTRYKINNILVPRTIKTTAQYHHTHT